MEFHIKTQRSKQIIDLTDLIQESIDSQKIQTGVCTVFIKHTTAALTTADLDPGTDLDMLDALEAMMPKLDFRHPHNPDHAPDHIWASIIGSSVTLPIMNSQLALGTWQRIILVELDGPRVRSIILSIIKS